MQHSNNFFLTKIRLSWYFILFFVIAIILRLVLPHNELDSLSLGVFSVSSFLFGFIVTPLLDGQRRRIERMHKITRTEANALFAVMVLARPLPKELKNQLRERISAYIKLVIAGEVVKAEKAYEELLDFCTSYRGKYAEIMNDIGTINSILEKLIENQQNRSDYNMQVENKIFSNEWMVVLVLFVITLGFTITIYVGGNIVLNIAISLLSTALCMLIINLVKMSTLTHKKAKLVWEPFKTLIESDYYRIDEV
jgi:ABC-type multidrug transport system fused ATPase/permease subunit